MGSDALACTDREYLTRQLGYAADKDEEAFNRGMIDGIRLGICIVLAEGDVVYVEESAFFSGLIRVRRKGETVAYWTSFEAVK
jgi:hypothetical protein